MKFTIEEKIQETIEEVNPLGTVERLMMSQTEKKMRLDYLRKKVNSILIFLRNIWMNKLNVTIYQKFRNLLVNYQIELQFMKELLSKKTTMKS